MKTIDNYLNVLNGNPLFKGMDAQKIKKTVSVMSGRISEYKKGEFLHRDYEVLSYFGVVLNGCVQVCIDDIEGNRMIMAEVVSGKSFGESLAFLKIENSAVYAFATENTIVLWLNPGNLFSENPDLLKLEIQKRFTSLLAMRPLEMNKRIQVLSKKSLRERIVTYLSSLESESGQKKIVVPLNREDMASYIGANRTALSRELSSMKKDGIIDFKKNTFFILS